MTVRLTLAGGVLAASVVLLHFQIEPIPTWFYVFAWYPTLLLLDCLVARLGGESLLARPRELVAMLWWSAVIWFGFEALNFRLQDWYYVFVPDRRVERWLGITLSFASVVPAIVLPARVLERLGLGRGWTTRGFPVAPRDLTLALWLGVATLAAILAAPRLLYPLAWGAIWMIAEPLLYRRDPGHSLFADIAAGRWGRIAGIMIGGLVAGALWEAFNAGARAKWIYTVPFLDELRLFEMPPLGFLGFPFFALEAWSLFHLLARWTRAAPIVVSVTFAAAVLLGMERWTISSTTPRLADLPGAGAALVPRLEAAGFSDLFRLARSDPAELVRAADLSPEAAGRLREAARLAALRGIGTRHARALVAGGIGSIAVLAGADPARVRVIARRDGGYRPTQQEARQWVSSAVLCSTKHLTEIAGCGR